MEHTPWKVVASSTRRKCLIRDAEGILKAGCTGEGTARDIVQAVNAHDKLVEALEDLLKAGHDGSGDYIASVEAAKQRAREVYKLAKGD